MSFIRLHSSAQLRIFSRDARGSEGGGIDVSIGGSLAEGFDGGSWAGACESGFRPDLICPELGSAEEAGFLAIGGGVAWRAGAGPVDSAEAGAVTIGVAATRAA